MRMRMRASRARDPAIGTLLDRRADLLEQSPRSGRDLGDRRVERLTVAGRRGAIATDLADELAGSRLDLTGRGRLIWTTKDFDGTTHAGMVTAVAAGRLRRYGNFQ